MNDKVNPGISDALKTVLKFYDTALQSEHIEKPVSWSLYEAWKAINRLEEKRSKRKEEDSYDVR